MQQTEWETAYKRQQNFVFYPHEEVIRFVSKYLRKRVGLQEFIDVYRGEGPARVLDVGCGIGRHVKYLSEYGLEAYGFDLSAEAISNAKMLLEHYGHGEAAGRVEVASITQLPYADGFFDFMVSHGVLDSMEFSIAQQGMAELYRCLKPGGLFYLDVISGDDASHSREFCGEEIVQGEHEEGTVQSYFNYGKLEALAGEGFALKEVTLIKHTSVTSGAFHTRYHAVLERR